ncbi:hypothetical protein [Polynucleobacter necessarius]|nr:hypothetical protein [Polynucleobacter necessarius]
MRSSALKGFDPQKDEIMMVESANEAQYVSGLIKPKLHYFYRLCATLRVS